jgi:integrase
MENLTALNFETDFSWPQGRRKPALVRICGDQTKNEEDIVFEIPAALAERLLVYRNEIAPAVTGTRPDAVFVTFAGKPRTQVALQGAIIRTILRQLGIRMTPHQFRHVAAKLHLDVNPGALDLVGQLLDHKSLQSTRRFYAGIDTVRAGRAHAELVMQIRESAKRPGHRPRTPRKRED